ncbi:MAG: hypothetical protein AAF959_23365 [Cyanobacteria bacterium P01_D01_bin.56]
MFPKPPGQGRDAALQPSVLGYPRLSKLGGYGGVWGEILTSWLNGFMLVALLKQIEGLQGTSKG